MLCIVDATKVIILNRLKLRQHVNNWPFVKYTLDNAQKS